MRAFPCPGPLDTERGERHGRVRALWSPHSVLQAGTRFQADSDAGVLKVKISILGVINLVWYLLVPVGILPKNALYMAFKLANMPNNPDRPLMGFPHEN